MNMLEQALKAFDGKTTSTLTGIRTEFGSQQSFLSDIVMLTAHGDPKVADGATWIVKNTLEDGASLTSFQTEHLIDGLGVISSWQAQLHICQLVAHLETSPKQTRLCADWLESLLQSDRPFLRAWSMNALQHLATQNAELKGRAVAALKAAEQDPAASVRARARAWR